MFVYIVRIERACKPGSVPARLGMVIHLGPLLPKASCDRPAYVAEKQSLLPCSRAIRLFDLAPGGVCTATSVTRSAVRSYRTISPLLCAA